MPGVIGMGVTQRPEELVQSSTVKNVGNRIQPMCFIGQILETSTEQFLFRNRRSNAIRKIIKISKFTKRTIEQIQTLQPYLQIDTEYILYPTYYSRKNNQNLLYRKDTEFQYIYNIKRKNKKVLIMCFVGNDDTESQAGQNIDIVPQSMISDQYDIRTLQV